MRSPCTKALALCLLALLTSLRSAPEIIVAEGQHRHGTPDQQTLSRQADSIRKLLLRNSIKATCLKDSQLIPRNLQGAKLVILPYNPSLPDRNLDALEAFAAGGGKLILFYSSDRRLCKLLGVKPGDFIPGRDFGEPSAIQFVPPRLHGTPETFPQPSWNGIRLEPATPETRVIARYLNARGKPNGFNAITQNRNGFVFSHILLNANDPAVSQALIAIAATAAPDVWRTMAEKLIRETGKLGRNTCLKDLADSLHAKFRKDYLPYVDQARNLRRLAQDTLAKNDCRNACALAKAASDMAREVYLRTRRSTPNELRGAWIHSAYGLKGESWDQTIRTLKNNGFNAIFVNFLWGYVADYNSQALPVHPDVKRRGDQLRLCLAACRKHGVELHAWKVCWNMGHRTPKHLRDQMARQGRVQQDVSGKPTLYLAPHLRQNQDLEVKALVDLVKNYDVDGIQLDYMRYPDARCDFSPSARKAFEAYLGAKVTHWPQDCHAGKLRSTYNQWRRNNITQTVRRIAREVRKANPKVRISAAVYGNWDDAPNSIAQETEVWIENGWIDFVCPMNYTTSNQEFISLLRRQISHGKPPVPLYPGIGSYRIGDPVGVAEQIEIARAMGADGFLCFDLSQLFTRSILPGLRKSIVATPALPPFPHHSPNVTTSLGKSTALTLKDAFAFPEKVTATLTFPQTFAPPRRFTARLLLDGNFITPVQPAVRAVRHGHAVTCSFIPPAPGTYRIELSDDRTFASKSRNIHVLSPEDMRQRQIHEGIPQFIRNGLPRVAVWQHNAYGCPGITQALRQARRFDVAPLLNLKPDTLRACQAIVIPQPRYNVRLFTDPQTVNTLRRYLRQGGAILVTHAMVGIRGFPILSPELIAATEANALGTNLWKPNPGHPITAGLPHALHHSTFTDLVIMTPTPKATPILYDRSGKKVGGIAGTAGKGKYVAIGLGLGIARGDRDCGLTAIEQKLLVNAVNWMTQP